MKKTTNLARVLSTVVLGAGLAACDSTPTDFPEISDLEAATSVIQGRVLSQVDRMGIPAVNTAFVASGSDKDDFNVSAPAQDEGLFTGVLTETIMNRYGLTLGQASGLADFVLPDVLPFGDLSGFPNGRRLEDDVIDTDLTLIFGVFGPAVPGLQSDGVDANDKPFSQVFPYLATPHT